MRWLSLTGWWKFRGNYLCSLLEISGKSRASKNQAFFSYLPIFTQVDFWENVFRWIQNELNGRVHYPTKRVAPRTVDAPGFLPQKSTIEEMDARLFRPSGNRGPSSIQWTACSLYTMNGRVHCQMKRFRIRSSHFIFMSMREGHSPDRGRSRAVCHKNHDRRDGFPTYSGLQRMEAVLYSAGSPNGLTAVAFVASEMIGHDTWLVNRQWMDRDGGTSEFCRFSNDEKGGDSPGHGSSRAFYHKNHDSGDEFPAFPSPGGWRYVLYSAGRWGL